MGQISCKSVLILIDGGSTHNFMQQQLVSTLGLHTQTIALLRVIVGNSDELQCHQLCRDILVHIQGHTFSINFHVLVLCGFDVVLGFQWLKSLGPILTDYNTLTMQFRYEDRVVELTPVTPRLLRRMTQSGTASTFFHLRIEPPSTQKTSSPNSPHHQSPAISSLIAQFHNLFQPPMTLPPARTTNHSITLIPNASSMNVRPYRYP